MGNLDWETTGANIAVLYLARGIGRGWKEALTRFAKSYKANRAGCDHNLYIVFKGFRNGDDREFAGSIFADLKHEALNFSDEGFDVGAYIRGASAVYEKYICFLNTNSELLCEDWLEKLRRNLVAPGVGLVGATGSYESFGDDDRLFPRFPNVHLRSNAFMILREMFIENAPREKIDVKFDAYLFESGPNSLTRKVLNRNLRVLVVGRNGRGYASRWWPTSGTFRQEQQENLLVEDNQTRAFRGMTWTEKRQVVQRTWGKYFESNAFRISEQVFAQNLRTYVANFLLRGRSKVRIARAKRRYNETSQVKPDDGNLRL